MGGHWRVSLALRGVAVAVILAFATGCATTSTTSGSEPKSPELMLASIQAGHELGQDDALTNQFRAALDSLGPKCKDRRMRLSDFTVKSKELLDEEGIGESLLSILRHVDASVPDNFGAQPCVDIFAAYVTLRESG
jgi:hypothetical protein